MEKQNRIALISTGGTIAGLADSATNTTDYLAGSLTAEVLLAALPALDKQVQLEIEALFSIDSKDITPTLWLQLARRVEHYRQRADIDAVLITHGTDTLEESAYFLHLVLPPGKPIVCTAAMRPASALSADGPMNLYQAIQLAASGITAHMGVTVAMNNRIYGARDLSKRHTQSLDAFEAPDSGPIGWADPPQLRMRPQDDEIGIFPLEGLDHQTNLPCVEVVYVCGGSGPIFLQNPTEKGLEGIVLALPGHGSLPAAWESALLALKTKDFPVILTSRTGAGPVRSNWQSPCKMRIYLMLCLASKRLDLLKALNPQH